MSLHRTGQICSNDPPFLPLYSCFDGRLKPVVDHLDLNEDSREESWMATYVRLLACKMLLVRSTMLTNTVVALFCWLRLRFPLAMTGKLSPRTSATFEPSAVNRDRGFRDSYRRRPLDDLTLSSLRYYQIVTNHSIFILYYLMFKFIYRLLSSISQSQFHVSMNLHHSGQ